MPEMPYSTPLPPDILNTIKQMQREIKDIWKSLGQNGSDDAATYMDIPFSFSGGLQTLVSPAYTPPDDDMTLYEALCTLSTPGTTDTVVTAYLNDSDFATITVPAGEYFAASSNIYQDVQSQQDRLSFGITTAGTGAVGLVVLARLVSNNDDDLDP